MNIIKSLIIAVLVLFSIVAESAMVNVSIVKNGTVGLNDADTPTPYGGPTPYFAGITTLNINGTNYQAMFMDQSFSIFDLLNNTNSDVWTWNTPMYTYDDIIGGRAPNTYTAFSGEVYSTPAEKFSKASWFLQNGMLGYDPVDPQWTASFNEMAWKTFTGQDIWSYSDRPYANSINSSLTLHDTYDMAVATKISPTTDYSKFMFVIGGGDTNITPLFLVYKNPWQSNPTPNLPIPPAIWLFGSGLLGLVTIARRKQK